MIREFGAEFLYCVITIIIDLLFIRIIFSSDTTNRAVLPKSRENKDNQNKGRWQIVVWRFERSPFVLLSVYSLISGIISFALICVFTINLWMAHILDFVDLFMMILLNQLNPKKAEITMSVEDVSGLSEDVALIVLTAYFSVFCTGFIALQSLSLLWFNYGDIHKLIVISTPFKLNVFTAHFWRACHLMTTVLFCVVAVGVHHSPNMSEIIGVFCQLMAIQGLIWCLLYFIVSSLSSFYIGYKLRNEQKKIHSNKKTAENQAMPASEQNITISRKLYPTDLFDLFLSIYFLSKCVHYNRNKLALFISFSLYTIVKYFKWYSPIWRTMNCLFTGKYRQNYTGNFLEYWKLIRNKSKNKKKQIKSPNKDSSGSWLTIYILFAVLVAFIAMMASGLNAMVTNMTSDDGEEILGANEAYDNYNDDEDADNLIMQQFMDKEYAPYPVCETQFGDSGLTSLDLILLTMIPYKNQKWKHIALLDQWFGICGWGQIVENQSFYPRTFHNNDTPAFIHIAPKTNNYDIIAVRGTKTRHDILQDINLFTEVASLQLISWIFPLTTFLPNTFLRDFIDLTSRDFVGSELFDEPVYEYIDKLIEEYKYNNSHPIFVVGHSLGGGIAEIVAARFANKNKANVISFGLSSPGVAFSSKKFKFNIDDLDKSSITIVPRRDIVPKVDRHGGFKQLIRCNQTSFYECHLAWSSFCEMVHSCSYAKYVRNKKLADCICREKRGYGGLPRKCIVSKKKHKKRQKRKKKKCDKQH